MSRLMHITSSHTPLLLLQQHILKHPITEVDPVIKENDKLQKVLFILNNITKEYNLEISVHKSKSWHLKEYIS
jgi:hypothetical protein